MPSNVNASPAPTPPPTVPVFIIRELQGGRREVRLRERALPIGPFKLEGSQRVNVVWYGGNPTGTATVSGSKEEPATVSGYWKDKFIQGTGIATASAATPNRPGMATNNGSTIQSVEALVDLIDDIRIGGALLEVQWNTKLRRGFLTKFGQTWHNVNDCEWEMSFEFISRGQVLNPVRALDTSITSDAVNGLSNRLTSLQDALDPPPLTPDGDWYGAVTGALGQVRSFVNHAVDNLANLAAQAQAPLDAIRACVSTLTGVIGQAEFIGQTMLDTPPSSLFTTALTAFVPEANNVRRLVLGPGPVAQSLGDYLQAEVYRRGVQNAADELRRTAASARATLLASAPNDILAVYTARAGDDLRDVSRLYFDTPFQWRQIMTFNQLLSAELQAGDVVLVPNLNLAGG